MKRLQKTEASRQTGKVQAVESKMLTAERKPEKAKRPTKSEYEMESLANMLVDLKTCYGTAGR